MHKEDYSVLRGLGKQLAEIANLPIQEEKRKLWIANNGLRPVKPLVLMDQLPWHEINVSPEMTLYCEDGFLRSVEYGIRQILYRWRHFPCDMVVENRIDIPMAVRNLNYGIDIEEETRATDINNDIVSHKYHDQIPDEAALSALKPDALSVDSEADRRHMDICTDIFHDIIPVRLKGVEIHAGVWDRIAQMRSVGNILIDIMDKPEFIRAIVQKFVDLTMATVDSCEEMGLLDADMQYVHCTGAYTDELPAPGFDPGKPRAKDCWAFGMAQMLATVSPAMFNEFEIELVKPLYERFGLLYYGCCEPIEHKIPYIKKIKNVRKLSVSPWADIEKCAEQIQNHYVFSSKPNPAYIADGFSREEIVKQVDAVLKACKRHNTPIEFILKDISTVGYKLDVLDQWEKLVMSMTEEG